MQILDTERTRRAVEGLKSALKAFEEVRYCALAEQQIDSTRCEHVKRRAVEINRNRSNCI
jgi:hypothetical protein